MKREFEDLFRSSSFADLFGTVEQIRGSFGLPVGSDESFDATKKCIVRFRKYLGLMQDSAKECQTWEELLDVTNAKIASADDVPENREEMAFFVLRDQYLMGLFNYATAMISEEGEEDGE